ncbi:adenylyl-sulfate kinase [Echinicola shivajiensis]|uniref:adenylyl-sulfate kinase n=1 Tax=Echinicola shivajiensis TaxID=1035916 RepID=UPI001BFCC3CB|nr:adenylyl-sulfate kinase [Echinicola shivajiensis]
MTAHVFPNQFKITQSDRIILLKQKPFLLWFTGLSGSGKSTLASLTETILYNKGYKTYLLDGDNLRSGLNKDLSFTKEGRIENLRRVGEVSKLMLDAGLIVIAAFISPFENERQMISELVGEENFVEVHVDCPLKVCEERDVKGLYQKARSGIITNFTGIDSPYEKPRNPHIQIKTHQLSIDTSVERIIEYLMKFQLNR